MKWTDEEFARARALAAECTTIAELAGRIGRTPDAVNKKFSSHGLAVGPLLKQVHPVFVAEQREERRNQTKQIAQLVKELQEERRRSEFCRIAAEVCTGSVKVLRREKTSGLREMTAVALASDWHVEETVDARAIAGRNRYNLDIADDRIKRFFDSIIWNIEHQRASNRIAIRDLVLWLGGDLITGYIHREYVETNELSPTEACRWLLPRLRSGIATLLDRLDLERIIIPCGYGNHGRTTDKPVIASGHANSFEWHTYHTLAQFVGDKRVTFEIPPSAHQYVTVYGQVLHFHHGDDLKYVGGVGGLGIPLLKRVPAWNTIRPADYHHIGHFHMLRDYGVAVTNGSLIGYNSFSQRIGAPFEPPQQAMYYIDSKRGKTMLTPMWVGDGKNT